MENIKYLHKIVAYMEKPDLYWQQNIKAYTASFRSNIILEHLFYPSSFESDNPKEDKDNLKKIKANNIFEPYEKAFLESNNIAFLTEEEKKNGEEYQLILIYFDISPIPQFKSIFKSERLNFYIITSYYEDGTTKVTVFYNAFPYYSHFENIRNAKVLTEETKDQREQHYLKALSDAIELICNEFEITTEKNQGNFIKPEKEDPEKLLEEFIEITHVKDFQNEENIAEFKQNFSLIFTNPEEYKEKMVEEGYFDEDTDIDIQYFIQFLLSEFLCTYDTDWKIDYEDLCEFISEEIRQDFKITYEEALQKPSIIVEKIKKESDYTMLNIDTQSDSYSFFICKKEAENRILELARKLYFPIEDSF